MNQYLKYWQLDRTVFLRPVESEQVYFTAPARAELERLLLMAKQPQTTSILIGPKGCGKSTLLKWLSAQFDVDSHEILLTTMISSEHAEGWLAKRLAEFMGTKGRPIPAEDLLRHVVGRLDELVTENRKLVMLIDAAHLSETPAAWRELAALMSLQALTEPCMSFVLSGEPALLQLFANSPELSTLTSFAVEIPTLTENDAANYIQHRLQLANISAEFTPEAIAIIAEESRGVIARINAIAENCLVECSLLENGIVTKEVATSAKHYIAGKPSIVHTPQVNSGGLLKPLTALYKSPISRQAPESVKNTTTTESPAMDILSTSSTDAPQVQSQEPNGIKLASLFKSDAGRRR